MQLLCTALQMKLDIDVGGAQNSQSCCFSSLLFRSHRREEGAGINHADNCAPHNERRLLESEVGFQTKLVKTFCYLGRVESLRRQEKHT